MQSTLSGHLKLIFDDGVSSNPLKTDRNLFWETIIKHLALLSHLACYAYIMLIFMAECKIRPGHGYYIFHLRSIRCCEGQCNLWFFFSFWYLPWSAFKLKGAPLFCYFLSGPNEYFDDTYVICTFSSNGTTKTFSL